MAVVLGSAKPKGVAPDINVTPLVDVVLVLLIIFMVTMPQMDKNVQVDLPQVKNADPKAKNKINTIDVTVDKDANITVTCAECPKPFDVSKRPFKLAELEPFLRDVHQATPATPVAVRAHKTLEFSKVRDVLAVVQKIEFPGTAFAVSKPEKHEVQPGAGGAS